MPDVPDVIEQHLVGDRIRSVVRLGAGRDNTAWLVNDEIVVRQARESVPEAVRREAALLGLVARHATLPVPEITFFEPDAGILAYRMLPGTPLIDIPDADTTALAEPLGTFLAAIHSIPLNEVETLVSYDVDPLDEWLEEAKENYQAIADHIPVSHRERVATFLAETPPLEPARMAFCHNDLGAEHILVDPDTMQVTGIIDWSDAAIADPVRDLALILRDCGPVTLDRALTAYGTPLTDAELQRLLFHARCKLIEDLAYGFESGEDRYVNAALAHLDWTFTSGWGRA